MPCLLDWWTYQRHCESASAKANTAESCYADWLSVGTPGAEPDGSLGGKAWWGRTSMAGTTKTIWSGRRSMGFQTGKSSWVVLGISFLCSGCECCYHCLQLSGCSCHLRDGVPLSQGNDFYDGYISIPSAVFQQVPWETVSRLGTATTFFDGCRASGCSEMASQVGQCARC